MKNLFDISGRVAIVTGGSKGIGLQMALDLAEAGAEVVIASRHLNEAQAAVDQVKEMEGYRSEQPQVSSLRERIKQLQTFIAKVENTESQPE